ncbi:hypothetical protein [Catellatospora sichuanensis]|uniref:hypothetical protein n=1 Tax=Catellatospora sichuanensis TaxID=1969805 RepID=UPI001183450A|nr:hypothetical protein [Catellatospora sichuanensis]
MELSADERARAVDLVRELRDPMLPNALGPRYEELRRLVISPRVWDLMFWTVPELTDEEVVEEALKYEPYVILGHPA